MYNVTSPILKTLTVGALLLALVGCGHDADKEKAKANLARACDSIRSANRATDQTQRDLYVESAYDDVLAAKVRDPSSKDAVLLFAGIDVTRQIRSVNYAEYIAALKRAGEDCTEIGE